MSIPQVTTLDRYAVPAAREETTVVPSTANKLTFCMPSDCVITYMVCQRASEAFVHKTVPSTTASLTLRHISKCHQRSKHHRPEHGKILPNDGTTHHHFSTETKKVSKWRPLTVASQLKREKCVEMATTHYHYPTATKQKSSEMLTSHRYYPTTTITKKFRNDDHLPSLPNCYYTTKKKVPEQ